MQYNQRKQIILDYLHQQVGDSFAPIGELTRQANLDQLPGVSPGEIIANDVTLEINTLIEDGHLAMYTSETPMMSLNWIGPPNDRDGFERCAKEWIAKKRAEQADQD